MVFSSPATPFGGTRETEGGEQGPSPTRFASHPPRTWLVLGDKRGDNGQVETIAAALPWPCERRFVAMLPQYVIGKPTVRPSLDHIDPSQSDPLEPPWPDLILTVGRRPCIVSLWIRRQSGGHTRIVEIGKPSTWIDRLDLVVASAEVLLPSLPNVVKIGLPLMRVERDARELEIWGERFEGLPRPLVGFLIGGPTHPFVYDHELLQRVLSLARDVVRRQGGTAYLTTSRRTPQWFTEALGEGLPEGARMFRWSPAAQDNPYRGILGLADGLVVSGDSISMMVEGVRMGRPVAILPLRASGLSAVDQARRKLLGWLFASRVQGAGSGRQALARVLYHLRIVRQSRDFRAFHRLLVDRGQAVWAGEPFKTPVPAAADEAGTVAGHIRRLMAE